jgi:hypothetical protein
MVDLPGLEMSNGWILELLNDIFYSLNFLTS